VVANRLLDPGSEFRRISPVVVGLGHGRVTGEQFQRGGEGLPVSLPGSGATNSRGKRKRTYRHKNYRTPYEKLTSLERWTEYLKESINIEILQRQAEALTGTEAARRMQKANLALLAHCRKTR
jgi:hypothetical protein